MKMLWNGLSFLAVINLLAILLFVGWLYQTGRLSDERIQEIRETLATTVAEETQLEQTAAEQAEAEASAALAKARDENPLPASADKVDDLQREIQAERNRSRRAAAEMEEFQKQLTRAQQMLATERAAFEDERNKWQNQTQATSSDAEKMQFERVVKLLEQLPAKQSKAMLVEMITAGETEEAVAYLNAMKPYNASEVLKNFKGPGEVALAAELLQRLKALGSVAESESPMTDDTATPNPG